MPQFFLFFVFLSASLADYISVTKFSQSETSKIYFNPETNFESGWSNLRHAGCDTGEKGAFSRVYALMNSSTLFLTNFGFDIPEKSRIVSITASYVSRIDETTERNLHTIDHGFISNGRLIKSAISGRPWKSKDRIVSIDINSNDINSTQINSESFGVYLKVRCGETNTKAVVKCVQIKVDYEYTEIEKRTETSPEPEPEVTSSTTKETEEEEHLDIKNQEIEKEVYASGAIAVVCFFVCLISVFTIWYKTIPNRKKDQKLMFIDIANDSNTIEI